MTLFPETNNNLPLDFSKAYQLVQKCLDENYPEAKGDASFCTLCAYMLAKRMGECFQNYESANDSLKLLVMGIEISLRAKFRQFG